jgi:hypothetical protein
MHNAVWLKTNKKNRCQQADPMAIKNESKVNYKPFVLRMAAL